MHDEPVLIHRFPCPAHCQATQSFMLYGNGGDGQIVPYCAHVHQAVNFLFLVIHILMLPTGLVGYDDELDSIIVAHQGSEGQNLYVDGNVIFVSIDALDANIPTSFTGLANAQGNLTNLDPKIFPNISSSIGVYQPYADIHTQCDRPFSLPVPTIY